MSLFKSPIVLITFKKHSALEEILTVISSYNPPKLYIFQDKAESEEDFILTEKVNNIIQNFNFNYPIEFIRHKTPLKLNKAVKNALDYCFDIEEKLIILEDDIVPTDSFFNFCNHLLVKYDGSSEIGCINGCNLEAVRVENKYFLSDISFPYWGWASWRDKWAKFSLDNYYWEHDKNKIVKSIFKENQKFFQDIFDGNARSLNVWDLQWNVSLIANGYKTLIPAVNLIENKGFEKDALSTNYNNSQFKEMKSHSIDVNTLSRKKYLTNSFRRKYEKKIRAFVLEVQDNLNNDSSKKFEV
jgi:hypothetical protein